MPRTPGKAPGGPGRQGREPAGRCLAPGTRLKARTSLPRMRHVFARSLAVGPLSTVRIGSQGSGKHVDSGSVRVFTHAQARVYRDTDTLPATPLVL